VATATDALGARAAARRPAGAERDGAAEDSGPDTAGLFDVAPELSSVLSAAAVPAACGPASDNPRKNAAALKRTPLLALAM
jgi:hypothetical protein